MRIATIGRLLVFAMLAPALSGCLAMGAIDRRAEAINRSVARSENTGLLLNLVRASRSEPLHFTSTTGVHAESGASISVSLPAFALGPGQAAAQKIYTIGSTDLIGGDTQTSFDVNVLASKDFYSGMLTPLGPADVNLLFSQGYSREMVLYLVVDRLKVTDLSGLQPGQDPAAAPTTVYFNDPRSPTFGTFKVFVEQAMLHGLTTDVAAGGPRLCYDLAIATPAAKQDFTPDSPLCGIPPSPQAAAAAAASAPGPAMIPVRIGDKKLEIVVYTRSIFGIFKYLGGLIAHDETAQVQLHAYPQLTAEETADSQMLVVENRRDDCFSQVSYLGADYCVPNHGAEGTKDIFDILDALLALKTSPGDLPATPTVRITP